MRQSKREKNASGRLNGRSGYVCLSPYSCVVVPPLSQRTVSTNFHGGANIRFLRRSGLFGSRFAVFPIWIPSWRRFGGAQIEIFRLLHLNSSPCKITDLSSMASTYCLLSSSMACLEPPWSLVPRFKSPFPPSSPLQQRTVWTRCCESWTASSRHATQQ